MSDFVYTTAIDKLRKLNGRVRVIPGGTSAGKTFGILPILIDQAAKQPLLEISVVSESIPHLRRGAMKDFIKIMKATGRYFDERWNRSLLTYTFANGSFIEFFSADQDSKLRGARRTHLYVNEANNISFESYHQLAIRTSQVIWLDFNPTMPFWAHEELKDAEWLTLTYKDNEALAPEIVAAIEEARTKAATSAYWNNWWNVYGLGQVGSLQGVVFDNWSQTDSVEGANLVAVGVDFGYTNDPSAVVGVYELNGQLIMDEIAYQTGMSNADIAQVIPPAVTVFADSAEPKSIADLSARGVRCKPVIKGKDSIQHGIQVLQERSPFMVTKRSVNLIKELRGYVWDTDAAGKMINKPIGRDHAIDAMRYACMMKFSNLRPKIKGAVI
jgi:phage terminase large subunit